ncbi:MAG: hypothetical protein M3362_01365 [Acidobacteriota bacterium]|nr:hypothetical protein [Acidobacteriota bacterium]
MREKVKRLVDRLEYRVEDSKFLPIKVPLFKLHSPSVKKAKVIYRELDAPEKEKGWWVKVFGIGTGPTKTLRVNYNPDFVSEKGECVQVFVPLVLNVKSIGVYKAGVLQNRGVSAEIEGIKDEGTLRKRGSQSLPEDECADRKLLGEYETLNFTLSNHKGTKLEKFKRKLKFDTARSVELQLIKVFGDLIRPMADVRHEQQIELEFVLPGSHDYYLSFGSGGLHWDIA